MEELKRKKRRNGMDERMEGRNGIEHDDIKRHLNQSNPRSDIKNTFKSSQKPLMR